MRPTTCHLLAAVDIAEPCPGEQCPFWDETCLLSDVRDQFEASPQLVQVMLGVREKLEDGPRPYVFLPPGFD